MTREEAKQMIESMGRYLSAGNPIWETEPVKEATRMAIEALEEQGQPYVCPRCAKVFGEPLQTACRCDKCKYGHLDPHDHADEYRCDKSEYVGRKWHNWWFGCFEGERRE